MQGVHGIYIWCDKVHPFQLFPIACSTRHLWHEIPMKQGVRGRSAILNATQTRRRYLRPPQLAFGGNPIELTTELLNSHNSFKPSNWARVQMADLTLLPLFDSRTRLQSSLRNFYTTNVVKSSTTVDDSKVKLCPIFPPVIPSIFGQICGIRTVRRSGVP